MCSCNLRREGSVGLLTETENGERGNDNENEVQTVVKGCCTLAFFFQKEHAVCVFLS